MARNNYCTSCGKQGLQFQITKDFIDLLYEPYGIYRCKQCQQQYCNSGSNSCLSQDGYCQSCIDLYIYLDDDFMRAPSHFIEKDAEFVQELGPRQQPSLSKNISIINHTDELQYDISTMRGIDSIKDLQIYIARKRGILDVHYKEIVLFTINGIHAQPSRYIEEYSKLNDNDSELILYYHYLTKIALRHYDRIQRNTGVIIPEEILKLIEIFGYGVDVEQNRMQLKHNYLNICRVQMLTCEFLSTVGDIYSDSVYDLKQRIEHERGANSTTLLFEGRELRDTMALSDYKVQNGSVVRVILRY